MPSTVEKLGPTRVKLTIEIPFADLKPHLDKAYADIAGQVNIPGFRKGKVPAAIIDQRFGRGAVLQEAINAALPNAYEQAVVEGGVVPLGQPEIEVTKLEDGDVVEFTAELDVRPDFEVPAFSELAAEVEPVSTDQTEVEQRIELMRQRFATREDKDGAAEEGDVVTIDLEASQDGQPVLEGSASGLSYKVGSGGMIEGLDEAVTGLKAGDRTEFAAELVGGPAKGEKADVTVTVEKVQTETLPEVDDEFAQMISEFDTVEEMRADLADAVLRMARVDQLNAARDAVVSDLVAKTPFELPEAMLAGEIEARKQQITEQLARAGYSVEDYLAESEDETAETPDEFWAQVAENAETSLKAQIILDKLADEREVGVDQSELTEMLFRRAQASGSSPEQEMQHMIEHNHAGEWMAEIRRSKVLGSIVGEATVTDTDGAVVDVAAIRPDGTLVEAAADESAEDAPAEKAPAKKAPAKKAAKADSEGEAKPKKAAAKKADKADEADAEAKPKKAAAKKAAAEKDADAAE
ncbi:trigger factor [Propioniciclava coleopterorum]|uniref:Trigger factor n=1 Tax=Propioniciclava coleopterorum TaxID=2714937 RepID=A0A6G7Y2W8_9ACTN|nr:trigger factor [Propioniciclava coleopterorum]QIK71152.1 trigger factor [Propioniciclava coleopterorum]